MKEIGDNEKEPSEPKHEEQVQKEILFIYKT
jgi:hypothetical protein